MKRRAEPPDDRSPIVRLEVDFAIPVHLSEDQERRLHDLLDEIVDSPWNQLTGWVHWLSGSGAKTNWSQADAAFLGIPADPDAPETGEPTLDYSVYHFETTARPFVSEAERARVIRRREKE